MALSYLQSSVIMDLTLNSHTLTMENIENGPSETHELVLGLIERGYFELSEEGLLKPTTKAITNVKVFTSGLDFDLLLYRLNFKSITRLFYLTIQKAFKDGIHLNVVFKNMEQEELDRLQIELDIAKEKKKNIKN